ncbi:unnamed protein product [Vicia faba]|uniref:Uncharacterized protein n=1 Tax=Vicia faba TaxID=3906 RepID=A0AAV0YJX8_VICFA|nr:unnamed protein product [Vicia faba]
MGQDDGVLVGAYGIDTSRVGIKVVGDDGVGCSKVDFGFSVRVESCALRVKIWEVVCRMSWMILEEGKGLTVMIHLGGEEFVLRLFWIGLCTGLWSACSMSFGSSLDKRNWCRSRDRFGQQLMQSVGLVFVMQDSSRVGSRS